MSIHVIKCVFYSILESKIFHNRTFSQTATPNTYVLVEGNANKLHYLRIIRTLYVAENLVSSLANC